MPSIADLTHGTVYQGNNGERWVVSSSFGDEKEINITLTRLEVEEILVKPELTSNQENNAK